MVQTLKAICDDMGGEGSFAVTLEVAVDPRISGRSEQVSSTVVSENTNLDPWDRLLTTTDYPDIWNNAFGLGRSYVFASVNPSGVGHFAWVYDSVGGGSGAFDGSENFFGCTNANPTATCFEYVTTQSTQTNRSFRRLVCPAQYTYVLLYEGQVIGTDATASQCVWKTYSAN